VRVRRRGFTLIEIMAVVVIIGLIATAAGLGVNRQTIVARQERARVDLSTIVNATDLFRLQRGRLPHDLQELVEDQHGTLRETPVDPWGRAYHLEVTGSRYEVSCLGADGLAGGEGEDADLRASSPGKR
jgi:general secretion pathway protein G